MLINCVEFVPGKGILTCNIMRLHARSCEATNKLGDLQDIRTSSEESSIVFGRELRD